MTTAMKQFVVETFPSDLGWMAIITEGEYLVRLTFGHRNPKDAMAHLAAERVRVTGDGGWNADATAKLQAFARGDAVDLTDIPLDLGDVTDFQRRVFEACRRIPHGETMTYGELASRAGTPRGARAVGNAMARNNLPLVIPCHRVVPAGQGIGEYSAGEGRRTKLRLLEAEASSMAGSR